MSELRSVQIDLDGEEHPLSPRYSNDHLENGNRDREGDEGQSFLNEEENSGEGNSDEKEKDSKCFSLKCSMIFFMMTTMLFAGLWLAESQYSDGVLRLRHLNETCGFSIFGNKDCAYPLRCTNDICIYDKKPSIIQCNETYIDQVCPKPIPCPTCPRCPRCQNLVSYFDFNEFPNHYISPNTQERTKIVVDIPYGGCKELCARNPNCKAICYQGHNGVCHIRNTYALPPQLNISWNCATKVGY